MRAHIAVESDFLLHGCHRARHQILGTQQRRIACSQGEVKSRRSRCEGEVQRIAQRNRLEDRAQLVITVRPLAHHMQTQINLRKRGQAHRFFLVGRASHAGELTAVSRNPAWFFAPCAVSDSSAVYPARSLCPSRNPPAPTSAIPPARVPNTSRPDRSGPAWRTHRPGAPESSDRVFADRSPCADFLRLRSTYSVCNTPSPGCPDKPRCWAPASPLV